MTDQKLIELSRACVALSNAHHMELILAMFEKEAIYTSAVGQFKGADAIEEMIAGFFARYTDVHWQTRNYRCDHNAVTFDFILNATEENTKSPIERSGFEQIEFNSQENINRLEVHAS
jgi:hypothetical protein